MMWSSVSSGSFCSMRASAYLFSNSATSCPSSRARIRTPGFSRRASAEALSVRRIAWYGADRISIGRVELDVEPVGEHVELQLADRGQHGRGVAPVGVLEHLDDALFVELVEALAELLELAGVERAGGGEHLGGELRDRRELHRRARRRRTGCRRCSGRWRSRGRPRRRGTPRRSWCARRRTRSTRTWWRTACRCARTSSPCRARTDPSRCGRTRCGRGGCGPCWPAP